MVGVDGPALLHDLKDRIGTAEWLFESGIVPGDFFYVLLVREVGERCPAERVDFPAVQSQKCQRRFGENSVKIQ